MIKKQAFNAVVLSNSISASSSYYMENEGELIQTNKLTYKDRVKEVKAEKEQVLSRLQNPDLSYRALATNSTASTDPEISYNIDSGTLTITILLITSDNINYTCVGIFQWETMPAKRYTDAFGLTRGNNLTIIGNSATGGLAEYYTKTNATAYNITTTEHNSDIPYDFEDLKQSTDGYGHAMEFDVPNNSLTMYSETESLRIVYNEMLGVISYRGMVAVDNVVSANNSVTYAHKTKNLTFTSIDFSISFPASFSLGGLKIEDTYIQRSTNHTWIR